MNYYLLDEWVDINFRHHQSVPATRSLDHLWLFVLLLVESSHEKHIKITLQYHKKERKEMLHSLPFSTIPGLLRGLAQSSLIWIWLGLHQACSRLFWQGHLKCRLGPLPVVYISLQWVHEPRQNSKILTK